MRHLILFFIGLITAASLVHTKSDLESCFDAAAPMGYSCCEMDMSEAKKTIMKECHEKFHNKNKCDFEVCYAEKKGFLFSNGTVNKSALEHIIEADLAKHSNIFSILKQKCFDVDITDYGEPETCYLKKLGNCMRFFVLANCPNWSNDQPCRKVKSATEECVKMLT